MPLGKPAFRRVLGRSRDLTDVFARARLPGIPHSTMQDDTFNGMFIPKGTMVFANAWYVTRCPLFLLQ